MAVERIKMSVFGFNFSNAECGIQNTELAGFGACLNQADKFGDKQTLQFLKI